MRVEKSVTPRESQTFAPIVGLEAFPRRRFLVAHDDRAVIRNFAEI
jgi:hypothetical protein